MFRLESIFPFLNWPLPTPHLLRVETIAGLTVGLMAIPQGVAYAALAGMPLVTGVYASLLPTLVAALWGGSVRLSVGPTALTCLLVTASLTGLAQPGSAEWVNLAVWLALLSGLLQVGLGLVRAGWLLNLVNSPVLTAFTQAAALLIISSQLPTMLGLAGSVGSWLQAGTLPALHLGTLAFGLGSLTVLWFARRLRPTFPGVLMVMVGAGALSYALGFNASGGAVVGALPGGMPGIYVPSWPGWDTLGKLVVPVAVISLVSFIETAASAKQDNAALQKGWDQNQDLIGQGMAKLAAAVSGAFPTSSSFSRSALNLYAGAQTGWANVMAVVLVLVTLLWLLPLLHHVPQAVLAAVVVLAVLGLVKPGAFVRIWRTSRVEAAIAAATFGITLLTAPRMYWGILTGVLLTLSHFLYVRLHPRIIEVGLHPDGRLRDRHLWKLPPVAPRTCALRMDAELDFGSASALEHAITTYLVDHPDTLNVMLFAQPINRIDATGVEVFGRLRNTLIGQGRTLYVVGLKLPVETALRQVGELPDHPQLRCFATEAEALAKVAGLTDSIEYHI
jgi:SulP family sulfate permease